MTHNTFPIMVFQSVLANLRSFLVKLVPEGQLASASGVEHPYELHNFMTMKISFFIATNDPNRDDLLVQLAMVGKPDPNAFIPAASVLANASTIRDFVELLVDFNFELSCATVYDADNPVAALSMTAADISMQDINAIQAAFQGSFSLSDWPNQEALWTLSGPMTVEQAIERGTK